MKVLLRALQIGLLLALAAGAFLLRCHNVRETFVDGHVYFLDADCYSRMTRVRMLAEGHGAVVRHHDFENFPEGVHSHATAPFDYLILGGKWLLDVAFAHRSWGRGSQLATQTADLAGALVSPVLGAATCVFLAWWGWGMTGSFGLRSRALRGVAAAAPALLCAVCPMLVHATVLGRPDHQSLLVLLLAVALGGEAVLAGKETARPAAWPIVTGLAWGFALWVSLYEPAVLFVLVLVLVLALDWRSVLTRPRAIEGGCLAAVLLLFLLVEGWPVSGLPPEVLRYFPAWSRTIGELHAVRLTDQVLPQWLGWLFYFSPILLIAARRTDRRAGPWLVLLLGTLALTCWQLRWGYFLALAFAMTLPWQLAALRRWWVAAPVFLVCFYPMAQAWEELLYPEDGALDQLTAKREENKRLRDIAEHLHGPFLAPWWESPALAYWSGQPGVAGSSHESLPGIADVSRFYFDTNDAAAPEILQRRRVEFVVADDADRLTGHAVAFLGLPDAPDCLAHRINDDPYTAEPYLKPVYINLFFKLFAVDRAKLNP